MLVDSLSSAGKPTMRKNRYRADGSLIVGPRCGEAIAEYEEVIRFTGVGTPGDMALLRQHGFTGPHGRERAFIGPRHKYEHLGERSKAS